jgi:hypothetical protein
MKRPPGIRLTLAVSLLATAGAVVHAGGHTWRVKEIFSNADGTIQYVEVWEANGTPGEVGTANHMVTSNANSFTIPQNVASPTTNRSLLLATQGFADLGVVTPDYIIVDNFFALDGDSISYTPLHTVTFGSGDLPTDGVLALLADLTTAVNSPQNYAGEMGSVDLGASSPPAVPAAGAAPLVVAKSGGGGDGAQLELSFDTSTCSGNPDHQVVFGTGSFLPAAPGGAFAVSGAACAVGGSPFVWESVPDPSADPSRFLWFLVLATDGTDLEGSWGLDADGVERLGPGVNGSSGQCGLADKDVSNNCGN